MRKCTGRKSIAGDLRRRQLAERNMEIRAPILRAGHLHSV
jgi:hypothetical protein